MKDAVDAIAASATVQAAVLATFGTTTFAVRTVKI